MRRQLFAVSLCALAPLGCKSVEVAVDYPGLHVAAKFEAHDRQPPVAEASETPASPSKKQAAKTTAQANADLRPSVTITL